MKWTAQRLLRLYPQALAPVATDAAGAARSMVAPIYHRIGPRFSRRGGGRALPASYAVRSWCLPSHAYNKRERMAWLSISIKVTAITITRPMAAVCSYLKEFMLSINFMPIPPAPIKPNTVAERVLLSKR
jgi:hypothetical protein